MTAQNAPGRTPRLGRHEARLARTQPPATSAGHRQLLLSRRQSHRVGTLHVPPQSRPTVMRGLRHAVDARRNGPSVGDSHDAVDAGDSLSPRAPLPFWRSWGASPS